jgi:glycosyltransferase involved in cell wall biosynthesis
MKILLIQHKNFLCGNGGTEKICCFLANNFHKKEHIVEIATNENCIEDLKFFIDKNIKITNIYNSSLIQKKLKMYDNYKGINPISWLIHKAKKKYSKAYNFLLLRKLNGNDGLYLYNLEKRSKRWEQFIEKSSPDVIITMSIESLLEITYNVCYEIPIINSTNGRPDYDYTNNLWYRSELEMDLLKKSYEKLSGIQILFDSYKEFIPTTFKGKYKIIPNPAPQVNDDCIVDHNKEKNLYKIINIASLVKDCKQQHIAIYIFEKLAKKFPNWNLYFYGTGTDLLFLKNLTKSLKIENRVFFEGFTDAPIKKLSMSDIFIFPSKYEGFPLALIEAMAVGLPSIGFKNCSGVNELIINKENGFLAESIQEMEEYLEILMINKEKRFFLGKNACQGLEKYKEDKIISKWLQLISELIKK